MDSYTLTLTSALCGGGWSTPRPSPFTLEKDTVPIVQETGWALAAVDLLTIQLVANRNIDSAIPAHAQ